MQFVIMSALAMFIVVALLVNRYGLNRYTVLGCLCVVLIAAANQALARSF